MKKAISIIVALAMVLTLSVSAFAVGESVDASDDNSVISEENNESTDNETSGVDIGDIIPDFSMPEFDLPTLPDFDNGGQGNFLDTLLNALNGLGGLIFGTDSGENDPTDDGENPWDDEDKEFNDRSLGDNSVVAIGAVAAVAAGALVITRKKSKDDDAK